MIPYCPRCDTETEWVNVARTGHRLACASCGLAEGDLLTEDEAVRHASPIRRPVRACPARELGQR